MTPAQKREIAADLHARLVAYWHEVDFNWGRNAGAYYTEDAIFETTGGGPPYTGRAEIEAFYAYRVDRGPRVNVHVISNFTCDVESETRALGAWVCTIYAHDGEAPQATAPPIVISLLKDIYVFENGEWLVKRRTWNPLFRGGAPGTHASADEIKKRLADKG